MFAFAGAPDSAIEDSVLLSSAGTRSFSRDAAGVLQNPARRVLKLGLKPRQVLENVVLGFLGLFQQITNVNLLLPSSQVSRQSMCL